MVEPKNADTSGGSRIFHSLRTVGQVSSDVPCLLRYIHRRRENFVITCVGKAFHTYASQKLQLLTTSGSMPDDITCMAVDTYHVYTACDNQIFAWRRGFELKHVYQFGQPIISLLAYPPNLISLHADGQVVVWDVVGEGRRIAATLKSNVFSACVMMHPATYINKILIGGEEGSMILLNIRTSRIIHHFKTFGSKILQIVQTPAVDVVAIALSDKRIILHNVRTDESLMKFTCLEETISIAFRLDGPPVLIIGSPQGSITLWDLETQELVSHIEKVHDGPVSGIQCFPQEPLFVTSSSDNSLKVWIFDMPDGSFRLLNSRDGHGKPSNRVRFFGKESEAKYILSSSSDGSFRMFHIYNETYNRCLSGSKLSNQQLKLKQSFGALTDSSNRMSPITQFTTQTVTAPSHHADIAACHNGQVGVSTWSFANTKRGDKTLMLPKYMKLPSVPVVATCITMTACCQFVIIGYDDGTVERFNIQSGIHRKTYVSKDGRPAHVGSYGSPVTVRGVAVDQLNITVLTGASYGNLKLWDFKTGVSHDEIPIPTGVNFIFHRTTDYFAGVALDDFSIYVINLSSRNCFRRFTEISSPVTDASFSPDNMWLTAATSDCLVRTWELSTSDLIDVVRLDSIVTSLDYSPTGEHVAGSFCNRTGIFIWSNKTLFGHVSLMPLPKDYEPPFLPATSTASQTEEYDENEVPTEYESPEQMDTHLITLSLLPESRWKNLLNLDTIKMRNKPKQPAKTYVAPFFLPSMISLDKDETPVVSMEISAQNGQHEGEEDTAAGPGAESKVLNGTPEIPLSVFGQKLLDADFTNPKSADDLCLLLGEMGPSKIDLETRSLSPDAGGSISLLQQFLRFATTMCQTKRNFENGQAYLALFLKIHGDTLYENESLIEELQLLQQSLPTDYLQNRVNKVLSFVTFLKSRLQ